MDQQISRQTRIPPTDSRNRVLSSGAQILLTYSPTNLFESNHQHNQPQTTTDLPEANPIVPKLFGSIQPIKTAYKYKMISLPLFKGEHPSQEELHSAVPLRQERKDIEITNNNSEKNQKKENYQQKEGLGPRSIESAFHDRSQIVFRRIFDQNLNNLTHVVCDLNQLIEKNKRNNQQDLSENQQFLKQFGDSKMDFKFDQKEPIKFRLVPIHPESRCEGFSPIFQEYHESGAYQATGGAGAASDLITEPQDDYIELGNKMDLMRKCSSSSSLEENINISDLKNNQASQIQFESQFESGNLAVASQVSQDQYNLLLQDDINTNGYTLWFYFRVSRVPKGTTIKFNILNMSQNGSLFNEGMKITVFSEQMQQNANIGWHRDGQEIHYFRNSIMKPNSKNPSNTFFTLTFQYTFKYEDDQVYFAYNQPYTYSDLNNFLDQLENNSQFQNIAHRKSLCRTPAGNQVEVLTITNNNSYIENSDNNPFSVQENNREQQNSSTQATNNNINDIQSSDSECENQVQIKKQGIIITARVHPGETVSSFIMKGVIEFLVSDSPDAVSLREQFIFQIVPMLNPDGVIHGNYRCSLAGRDLNRRWENPCQILFPEISNTKRMIEEFSQQTELAIFIDIHGHSQKKNVFLYGCHDQQNPLACREFPFLLSKLNQDYFSFLDCNFAVQQEKNGTARISLWQQMRNPNIFTLESSFCGPSKAPIHFTTSDLEKIGQSICQALLIQFDYSLTIPEKFQQVLPWPPNFNAVSKSQDIPPVFNAKFQNSFQTHSACNNDSASNNNNNNINNNNYVDYDNGLITQKLEKLPIKSLSIQLEENFELNKNNNDINSQSKDDVDALKRTPPDGFEKGNQKRKKQNSTSISNNQVQAQSIVAYDPNISSQTQSSQFLEDREVFSHYSMKVSILAELYGNTNYLKCGLDKEDSGSDSNPSQDNLSEGEFCSILPITLRKKRESLIKRVQKNLKEKQNLKVNSDQQFLYQQMQKTRRGDNTKFISKPLTSQSRTRGGLRQKLAKTGNETRYLNDSNSPTNEQNYQAPQQSNALQSFSQQRNNSNNANNAEFQKLNYAQLVHPLNIQNQGKHIDIINYNSLTNDSKLTILEPKFINFPPKSVSKGSNPSNNKPLLQESFNLRELAEKQNSILCHSSHNKKLAQFRDKIQNLAVGGTGRVAHASISKGPFNPFPVKLNSIMADIIYGNYSSQQNTGNYNASAFEETANSTNLNFINHPLTTKADRINTANYASNDRCFINNVSSLVATQISPKGIKRFKKHMQNQQQQQQQNFQLNYQNQSSQVPKNGIPLNDSTAFQKHFGPSNNFTKSNNDGNIESYREQSLIDYRRDLIEKKEKVPIDMIVPDINRQNDQSNQIKTVIMKNNKEQSYIIEQKRESRYPNDNKFQQHQYCDNLSPQKDQQQTSGSQGKNTENYSCEIQSQERTSQSFWALKDSSFQFNSFSANRSTTINNKQETHISSNQKFHPLGEYLGYFSLQNSQIFKPAVSNQLQNSFKGTNFIQSSNYRPSIFLQNNEFQTAFYPKTQRSSDQVIYKKSKYPSYNFIEINQSNQVSMLEKDEVTERTPISNNLLNQLQNC